MSFSDEDKVGTMQPHDDALVVTLRIGGYDVKRVLVYQGNDAKIMYPDLYKGLQLKPENLACYDSPLIWFDGKIVFPKDQIRLLVQAGSTNQIFNIGFKIKNKNLHGNFHESQQQQQ